MKKNKILQSTNFKIKAILALFVLTFFSQFSIAQITPTNRGRGGLLITPAQYAAIPDPNWAEIKSYSTAVPNAEGVYTSPAVVMLNNPPIGDQQTQGSCVGWAVGYTAMGVLTYPKFNCWDVARRSPSYVYNQIKVGAGCGGGSYPIDALNLVKNQGVCSFNLKPYDDAECSSLPNMTQTSDAGANKAINFAKLAVNDLASIKQALVLGFPVIVGQKVYQSFYDMGNSGGIWTTNSGTYWGRHATCVVGYDDTRQQLKIQNQWGTFWGDNGYYWAPYSFVTNSCFDEVYILYGSTPSIPLGITGPDPLCSNSIGSYTISSLPCNSSVKWSLSSNSIGATISTTVGNTTSITIPSTSQNAILTLTANITGISNPITKQIYIGAPYFDATYKNGVTAGNPVAIYFPNQGNNNLFNNVCIGYGGVPNVYIDGQPSGANNINWSVPNGYATTAFSLYTGYGNRAYFAWNYGGSTPPGYIQARVSNGCGTYSQIFAFKQVNCGTPAGDPCPQAKGLNYYTISPNPASDNIKIGIANKPAPINCNNLKALTTTNGIIFSVVNVYDNVGTLVKSYKTKAAKTATIQIGNLIAGSYLVEIIQEDYSEKQQIIIQK